MYTTVIKPFFDFVFALFLLILTSPLLLLIILLLSMNNKGGVFFVQQRPGKNQKPFFIYKFKTMNEKRDEKGNLLSDVERLTWIGRIIRITSLDELPQLINVLKGEMSFIGPRPLLMQYLNLYNEEQKRRHLVKPGITGWAQINGRNAISWTEKFKLDVGYVEKVSFLFDLKILFRTFIQLFKTQEVNADKNNTSEFFNGRN